MNTLRNGLHVGTQAVIREALSQPQGPWRLAYHIEPQTGWLNDPNGLSYMDGWHHVFYQCCPFFDNGGIKFWAHCRSQDLTKWEQLPFMLFSDEPFDVSGAYSGSAIPTAEGLTMFYTGNVKYEDGDFDYILNGREQNTILAVSKDGVTLDKKHLLMTNQDYPADMTRHVRDPKVFACDGKYYMVLGARTKEDIGVVLVYESPDCYSWSHINTLKTEQKFGYMWECPDLFEIGGQWFLLISPQGVRRDEPGYDNVYTSGAMALTGDFRGSCSLGAFQPLDYGFDFYAPQTYDCEGRRLMIGWMGMPDADYSYPTANYGYQQALTQVRTLTRDGDQLHMAPAAEVEALRTDTKEYSFQESLELEISSACDIEVWAEGEIELDISGAHFTLADGELRLDFEENGYGRTTRRARAAGVKYLRFLVDTSSIECFPDNQTSVMTTRWFPPAGSRVLRVKGAAKLQVHTLKPFDWTEKN